MEKTWAEFYKRVSGDERELVGNIYHHRPFVEELARWVKVGCRVLEVGSGSGVLGTSLALAGVKVVSLDNDQEILNMAKVNAGVMGVEIEYVFGDALKLPFADGEFDLVWSHGLVEHFDDAEFAQVVSEHRRVGKMVVIGLPLKGCVDGSFGNERWFSRVEWERRFEKLGLVKSFAYNSGDMLSLTLKGNKVGPGD
jgi:2-polyprenyl-3-methyl-5-hydroxy-6-metoxy-1,4-benzoquinol methylase